MALKPARRRKAKLPGPGPLQRLRTDFLTGLVIVLPVFLTIYLIWTIVGFIDARVLPLVPSSYRPEAIFGRDFFGFGLIIFLVFTVFVGWLAKGFLGRQLIHIGERIVDRMPIVRSIYTGAKQIVETVFSQTSSSFSQACIVEYPRRGIWAIAFISTDARGEVPLRAGEPELVSVFLPTTPNPTSGFLLFVPRKDVVVLDMSVEEAAKLVISAGLVSPPTKAEVAAGRRIAVAK
jgi:uncharacterized membrane protein